MLKQINTFERFSRLLNRKNILEYKFQFLTKILNTNRKSSLVWNDLGLTFLDLYLLQKDEKTFFR